MALKDGFIYCGNDSCNRESKYRFSLHLLYPDNYDDKTIYKNEYFCLDCLTKVILDLKERGDK